MSNGREEVIVVDARPYEGKSNKMIEVVGFVANKDNLVGLETRRFSVPDDGFNITSAPKTVRCYAEFEEVPSRNGGTYRKYLVCAKA